MAALFSYPGLPRSAITVWIRLVSNVDSGRGLAASWVSMASLTRRLRSRACSLLLRAWPTTCLSSSPAALLVTVRSSLQPVSSALSITACMAARIHSSVYLMSNSAPVSSWRIPGSCRGCRRWPLRVCLGSCWHPIIEKRAIAGVELSVTRAVNDDHRHSRVAHQFLLQIGNRRLPGREVRLGHILEVAVIPGVVGPQHRQFDLDVSHWPRSSWKPQYSLGACWNSSEPVTPSARRFTTVHGAQKVSTSKSRRNSSLSHTCPWRLSASWRLPGSTLISCRRILCACSSSVRSCGVI